MHGLETLLWEEAVRLKCGRFLLRTGTICQRPRIRDQGSLPRLQSLTGFSGCAEEVRQTPQPDGFRLPLTSGYRFPVSPLSEQRNNSGFFSMAAWNLLLGALARVGRFRCRLVVVDIFI